MVPVCWFEGIVGVDKYSAQFANDVGLKGRSRYACTGILNEAMDSYGDLFEHYSGWDGMPFVPEYAVLVIHGGHLRYQVDQINEKAQQLQGVLFIIIGDEECDFPDNKLWHRNMRVWRQSPLPSKAKADRYILVGYPVDCRELLVHGQERDLDWFFAGQVTHARRHECVEQLRKMQNKQKGWLLETQQFYSGMGHAEYFKTLGRAKIVPCVSGPVCSDTFRLAETLEAGAVPIIDSWPGWKDKPVEGFWEMLFPQGYPWMCVKNYADLPDMMAEILNHYEYYQKRCTEFWAKYKQDYFSWLRTDLRELGVSI